MDHHCPWIMGCVGYHNMKYFFLLCFYVAVSGLYYVGAMIYTLFFYPNREKVISGVAYGVYIATGIFLITIISSMSYMTVLNLTNFASNVTTIEKVQGVESPTLCGCCVKDEEVHIQNNYDMGFISNLEQLFGRNSLLYWFLPMTDYKDQGFEYKMIPAVTIYDVQCRDKSKLTLNMGGKKLKIGETVESYLIDAAEKYQIQNLDYADLLVLNNIKAI